MKPVLVSATNLTVKQAPPSRVVHAIYPEGQLQELALQLPIVLAYVPMVKEPLMTLVILPVPVTSET